MLAFSCFFFVDDQTQTSTKPIRERNFEQQTWDVYSPKAVEIYIFEYIFFGFYGSVGFKANIEYTKKGYCTVSSMECTDVAAFTFAM